jgi:hypothetical protein
VCHIQSSDYTSSGDRDHDQEEDSVNTSGNVEKSEPNQVAGLLGPPKLVRLRTKLGKSFRHQFALTLRQHHILLIVSTYRGPIVGCPRQARHFSDAILIGRVLS